MISPPEEARLRERQRTLEGELARPDVVRDRAKLKRLSAEHHRTATILALLDRYHRLSDERAKLAELKKAERDPELLSLAEADGQRLDRALAEVDAAIDEAAHPGDPLDEKSIVVEIRAGAGGDEASLFAAQLFRMYSRYAEAQGWRAHLVSASRSDIGGFKEVIFTVEGDRVYRALKFESGVHRVQRIPETEKSGRVHTSTVTVVVMPEAEEVDLTIDPKDLKVEASTASGHGGQSVNTTYSAVRLTHLPTGLVVQCQDERNFQQNKLRAMSVLRSRLLDLERRKREAERTAERRSQIGTGDRSEKIRTYNFPQDRVTDHRLNQNFHNLAALLDGGLQPAIAALQAHARHDGAAAAP